MSDVVPDSIAVRQERGDLDQERGTRNEGTLKIGIFHADADGPIATRIRDMIRNAGYTVDLCEFHDAGNPTIEIIDNFTLSHHLVLWMATNTSLGDKNTLKHARYIAQHAANCTTGMPLRFALLKPSEGYTLQLPPSLAAYTPLIEDDNFRHSLDTTMESIREKLPSLTTQGNRERSSATQNAVTDTQDRMPRQTRPSSDSGTVIVQEDSPGTTDLRAIPEPQGSRLDQRVLSAENVSRQGNVNIIHVYGDVRNIQVGESNDHLESAEIGTHEHREGQGNEDPK